LERGPDKDPPSVGVVLPAGGKGLRTGTAVPKQFLPIGQGRPMLAYAVEAFHCLAFVESIALVLPPERMAEFSGWARTLPKVKLVEGGSERWESVRNGFLSLEPSLPYVLVHDAARPFVSEAVIRRCLAAAAPDACVIAALPAADTIKETEGALVTGTLDRGRLILVQTPQVFPRAALEKAYAMDWRGAVPTDEAMMAERAGCVVRWVRGSDVNRKVTTAADLEWAEWIAGRLESGGSIPDA